MSLGSSRSFLALTLLALGLAAVPAAAAGDGVCDGFNRQHKISRLGGSAAFTKTPVKSPADLKAQLDARRGEIDALMAAKGLGHLTDALYAAIVSGEGLSERNLVRGETFEWMVYRKASGPVASGPVCIATKKTYDAYVIEVTEEQEHPVEAACALKVTGGACIGDRFAIDTTGSSPGVKVDVDGPGGSKNPPEAAGTYRFTASAEARGTKTVTTHTFVIPKICLNLAYAGQTSKEAQGASDTCEQTASVSVKDCTPPPPPPMPEPEPEPEMSRWTARFFGIALNPDDGSINDNRIRPDGLSERSKLSLESGIGVGAGLEYHFTPRVGLEGTVLYVPIGTKFFFDIGVDWAEGKDDTEMLAFLIGPNFHLTPEKRVDVYIGPFVVIADLGSTSYQVLGETHRRSLDADTVFGAQLGVDVPFGKGAWGVHFGARYMDMSVKVGNNAQKLAADPLGLEVGFAYKF